MDAESLRAFLAVADAESVTTAAAMLRRPQPTISRTISRLERELGRELFDRVGRTVQLNQHGRAFLPHARTALAELETGLEMVQGIDDPEQGSIRLGFLHSLGAWLVPDILQAFRAEAPRIRFQLRQAAAGAIIDMLKRRDLDLILTGPRPDDESLRWQQLHTQQLMVVAEPGHPLVAAAAGSANGTVSLRDVVRYPYLAMTPGHGMRTLTDRLLSADGLQPCVEFEGTDIETLRGLAGAGLGVAIVPKAHFSHGAATVELPLEGADSHRDLGVAWLDGSLQSPVVQRFFTFVRRHPIR
ncbi:LysR substrate-binding domain-containing protein [Saxibacter everestensis]|uniref:LysR substrate-binding domain-containing protein n=1 Tax=Saxibacter everestensis TaxID=2909229 RepID=A0ABY8QQ76_9MICO|nr:LysR substrate-binding domain-containing protein [Brevibacteriaceae bacterium ZFBP1038]